PAHDERDSDPAYALHELLRRPRRERDRRASARTHARRDEARRRGAARRRDRAGARGLPRRRAGLLGVPADRGIGGASAADRDRNLRDHQGDLSRSRRGTRARPHETRREGAGHGGLQGAQDPAAGRDYRDRSRRRRAERDAHGDRARRAHGARATAPASRARRTRLATEPRDPALLSTALGGRARAPQGDLRDARWFRDRSPGPDAARARRVPRRAPERHAAPALRRPREGRRSHRDGACGRRRAPRREIPGSAETSRPLARQPPVLPQGMKRVLARLDAYERLVRLDRPIGILLLLWPTLWALWLARGATPPPMVLWLFVLGAIVTRSAGCAVNDFADRKFDAQVKRTRDRPLAAGM